MGINGFMLIFKVIIVIEVLKIVSLRLQMMLQVIKLT